MSRVARLAADRTNQKLYFVKLACQQADNAQNVQYAQSCRESALFHLQGALYAYYQELSRYYSLNLSAPDASKIAESLLAQGERVSPELQRLAPELSHGFLHALQTAITQCQYAPLPAAPEYPTQDTHVRITLQTDPLHWLPDTTTLRAWLNSLTQYIEQFRNEQQEF